LFRGRLADQSYGLRGTGGDAEAATDAAIQINDNLAAVSSVNAQCVHLAAVDTGSAALARFVIISHSEWRRDNGGGPGVAFYCPEDTTTATAAKADVADFLGIARLQNQSGSISFLENAEGLLFVYHPTQAVFEVKIR